MFQVRLHGRGGQGTVTAAELLSVAAFLDGRQAQAFPSFGSERTGAPVVAFCRIDDRPIRVREPIDAPDALIIQDPTLLYQVDVLGGLRPDGFVLLNSEFTWHQLNLDDRVAHLAPGRALVVPATRLAREHVGRPLPNAALLGGFAAISGLISMGAVAEAIRQRFVTSVAEANIAAAEHAHAFVRQEIGELADA